MILHLTPRGHRAQGRLSKCFSCLSASFAAAFRADLPYFSMTLSAKTGDDVYPAQRAPRAIAKQNERTRRLRRRRNAEGKKLKWNEVGGDQIKYGLRYIPGNVLKSFFIPAFSDSTKRSGGEAYPRCLPSQRGLQIKRRTSADTHRHPVSVRRGRRFVRLSALQGTRRILCAEGIRVMAVTLTRVIISTPGRFPPAGERGAPREIALFFLRDLKGIVPPTKSPMKWAFRTSPFPSR